MDLKSKREAAELLGVSTRGIERAVRRGQLHAVYHDSKHGKKAWFSSVDLELYRQQQRARPPAGFMTSGNTPTIGTVIPAVEMYPRVAEIPRKMRSKAVPITERLVLTLADASQLAGLPRKFLRQSIHSGALKSVKIGRITFIKRIDLNEFVQGL